MISVRYRPATAVTEASRAGAGSARAQRSPDYIAALENPLLVEEIRRLLRGLLGETQLELLPEDGTVLLSRLRPITPRLVFLNMQLRRMEGLTVLRALPAALARRAVLLVPDTLEGYRVAWEALSLGAGDVIATRGDPPHRLKGNIAQRLRQLAGLLAGDETSDADADCEGENGGDCPETPVVVPSLLTTGRRDSLAGATWLVPAETRNLFAVARWIRCVERDAPVVIRVPEGPRMLRVVREGLGSQIDWPVRLLKNGDRLAPGQVHLFGEFESLRVVEAGGRGQVELQPAAEPPGSWGAHSDLLRNLRDSSMPLRIVLPEREDPEQELFLMGGDGVCHGIYHLQDPRPRAVANWGQSPVHGAMPCVSDRRRVA